MLYLSFHSTADHALDDLIANYISPFDLSLKLDVLNLDNVN